MSGPGSASSLLGFFDPQLTPVAWFDSALVGAEWFDVTCGPTDYPKLVSRKLAGGFDSGMSTLGWFDECANPSQWWDTISGAENFPTLTTLPLSLLFTAPAKPTAPWQNYYSAWTSGDRTLVYASGSPAPSAGATVNGYASAYFDSTASDTPTFTSLNYALGDTAGGGQTIIVTGTNLSGQTCTLGGTSCTIVGSTSTTLSFTLPAGTAGLKDLVIGGVTTAANAFEYWLPTQVSGIDTYIDANKGITLGTGTRVTAWLDQQFGSSFANAANDATCPDQIASVFGTLPSIRFTAQTQFLDLATSLSRVNGIAVFAVAKWTSSDSTAARPEAAPLNIVGDGAADGSGFTGFGASAGTLQSTHFTGGWVTTNATAGGTGLNDGTARLIGGEFVEVGAGLGVNTKFYVGASQVGSTTNDAGDLSGGQTYGTIGNAFSHVDGFLGDLGAVVVLSTGISGGDLTKLNHWAQQRFGTP